MNKKELYRLTYEIESGEITFFVLDDDFKVPHVYVKINKDGVNSDSMIRLDKPNYYRPDLNGIIYDIPSMFDLIELMGREDIQHQLIDEWNKVSDDKTKYPDKMEYNNLLLHDEYELRAFTFSFNNTEISVSIYLFDEVDTDPHIHVRLWSGSKNNEICHLALRLDKAEFYHRDSMNVPQHISHIITFIDDVLESEIDIQITTYEFLCEYWNDSAINKKFTIPDTKPDYRKLVSD